MLLRLSAILLAFGLAACAPATNTSVERQALGIQGTVYRGTIIAMRPVTVSGSRSGLGGRGQGSAFRRWVDGPR